MSTGVVEGLGEVPANEGAAPSNQTEGNQLVRAVYFVATPLISLFNFICPVNPVTEQRELWYIPKPFESFLGRLMYPVMTFTQGGAMDHFYTPKVNEIMRKLAVHSKREFSYEVKIINKDVVNAWCLPGGKMAIYKLLLEKIDFYVSNKKEMGLTGYTHPETGAFISYEGVTKDDVIAALLGHEMTHADARHTARKLELSFVVQLLVFGVSGYTQVRLTKWKEDLEKRAAQEGSDPKEIKKEREQLESWQNIHALAFSGISKLAIELYMLMGSRRHELEADKYGTRLAVKAGYNPAGALLLQEILKKESRGLYDYLPKLFQKIHGLWHSHPPCAERQGALFTDSKNWKQQKVS